MAARCGRVIPRYKNVFTAQDSLFKTISRLGSERCFHSSFMLKEKIEKQEEVNGGQKIYGYIDGKRDRNEKGLQYMGMIELPEDLKMSYNSFCKRYPKKRLTEDGMKIAKHLQNRGRPTEQTWKKLKEAKRKIKAEICQFSVQDAEQESAINGESSSDDSLKALPQNGERDSMLPRRDSKAMAPKKAEYSVIRYGKREIAAFAASRIPACFGATKKAFSEVSKRDPDFAPKTLLDFGSGTGTATWAAHDIWGTSLREYQCIDVSEDANNTCEYLLRDGTDPSKPLKIPGVYFRRFLPLSNKVTYDIVVSAYTLSELPFRKQRQFALSNLWAKTNDYLVLVEPGSNEGFDIMLQARNYVTKGAKDTTDVFTGHIETDQGLSEDEVEFMMEEEVDKGYVFAPCPHDVACPRSEVEARDHPCNFEQKVQLAFSQRNTTLKRRGHATERFAYLILRKGERNLDDRPMPRLLEAPKQRKRHVICNICNSNGNIEQYVFTKKKDPDMYKGVKHCVKWGDSIPISESKRPKKIITFENEIIIKKDKED